MAAIFQRLRDLFSPRASIRAIGVLGTLTPGDISALRALRAEDGWDVYLSALDAAVNLNAEVLLQSSDDVALRDSLGVIKGLRKAASLVDEILTADAARDDHASRAGDRDAAACDSRRAALYGTPAWGK